MLYTSLKVCVATPDLVAARTGHSMALGLARQSAICNVIGYTKGSGNRYLLGALVIGEIRDNRMIDRGRVGSGISTKALEDLLSLLHPLTEKNGVTWVDPSLQIEVTYFEETEGGHFRFPIKRIVSKTRRR